MAIETEAQRWKELYRKMRNIAAGYSQQVENENGTTRRLDAEFKECEIRAEIIGTEHDLPQR
jgi:hypothetical protein